MFRQCSIECSIECSVAKVLRQQPHFDQPVQEAADLCQGIRAHLQGQTAPTTDTLAHSLHRLLGCAVAALDCCPLPVAHSCCPPLPIATACCHCLLPPPAAHRLMPLPAACCLLPACRTLPAACCLLPAFTACCYCLLPAPGCCTLAATHWLLPPTAATDCATLLYDG